MSRHRIKYSGKRMKLILKGVLPSLIALLLPKKRSRIIFNSTVNEFFDFNSKHLFEYFIKNYPEYETRFVINDIDKRNFLNIKYGSSNNYFIETESISGMFYALRAGVWITSSFETPVGGLFLNVFRFVFLLGHGTHFKAIVFNENNLSLSKYLYYHLMRSNVSCYLVTSKALLPIYKNAYKCHEKKLQVLGEPRSDKMYDPDIRSLESRFGSSVSLERNVLYAPTWRSYIKTRIFPFDNMNWDGFSMYLDKNNINIYLRMHPSYQDDLKVYTSKTSRIKILDNCVVEDVSDVIGVFDLLVTDYSSIYISFLLLEKPVMFLPYDLDLYLKKQGFIASYDELTPGPKPVALHEFQSEILLLLQNPSYFKNERERVSRYFNDFKYENCKMNAEFILSKAGIN